MEAVGNTIAFFVKGARTAWRLGREPAGVVGQAFVNAPSKDLQRGMKEYTLAACTSMGARAFPALRNSWSAAGGVLRSLRRALEKR